jgi:hypothetical protein
MMRSPPKPTVLRDYFIDEGLIMTDCRVVSRDGFGERVVALQIGVSRNTLRRMISGGNRAPSHRVLRRIATAAHAQKTEAADRRATSARLRELAKTEGRKIGVAELARRLSADPSNLRKAINGEREFGLKLEQALRRNGGAEAGRKAESDTSSPMATSLTRISTTWRLNYTDPSGDPGKPLLIEGGPVICALASQRQNEHSIISGRA